MTDSAYTQIDRHVLLQRYLQGSKEKRTYNILALIEIIKLEYNQMYPDKPLK